ncbi:complement C1q tumor necrosis factor-related protein 6-like [Mercenaria mercenaria]|uniref:complement C1q tumor necrosis factor-related protein 6-like n=1 Tax=Mercenaria mercenaria TaxID=6596 RepID=UPI00234F6AE1|nr:complement C1q tumor necrosis factor-related protein 6-like [Mercenaria mercenaria]
MSTMTKSLIFVLVLFIQSCSCEDSPRTYSVHELSQFVRTFDLKLAEIEAKLEKQTNLNRKYEEKINDQDRVIRTLSDRLNTQATKILKCEKQVKQASDYFQSLIHSLSDKTHGEYTGNDHDPYQNSTKDHAGSQSSLKGRFGKLTGHQSVPNRRQARQSGECTAFSVYLNRKVTGLGPDHTIQHGGVVLNEGNAYNVHTGVFTAPTNGVYLFTFAVENYDDHRIWVKIVVNGELRSTVVIHPYPGYRTMGSNSVVLRLKAGESVWTAVDSAESGDSIEGSSQMRATTFSGVLLCQ